jgi:hypothetical protein
MGTLKRMKETGQNIHQKYKYVTVDDLLDAIREPLAERGVTIVQEHVDILSSETSETRSGTTMKEVSVLFNFILTHAASGETQTFPFVGVGADTGDKWYSKASTSAEKYFIRRLFLMTSGDEDEDKTGYERSTKPDVQFKGAVIGDKQRKQLFAEAKRVGLDAESIRMMVGRHNGGNESTANLPVDVWRNIMQELKVGDGVLPAAVRSVTKNPPTEGSAGDTGGGEESPDSPLPVSDIIDKLSSQFDAKVEK